MSEESNFNTAAVPQYQSPAAKAASLSNSATLVRSSENKWL
jgi:hypothetical protein